MSKGIYTKENVGNGAFIFTVNKNFVEPKFWGLHEENEQAQCVVIIHDGNALFFYPEDMDNNTHILLDCGKDISNHRRRHEGYRWNRQYQSISCIRKRNC